MKLRRKREGKTDYKKRLEIVKSKKLRLVVRKSLKNIQVQIIEYHPDGDKVILSAHTKELIKKYNWKAKRNTPTAYLIGLLIASKAKQKNIKQVIFDIGLYKSIKGAIIYAVLKGAVDNGLDIPHNKDIFPKQERILGKHTKYTEQELKNFQEIITKIKGEQHG